MGTILTMKDAVRLLDIPVDAIKAWADMGALRCWRTPGGHRRFNLADVLTFGEKMRAGEIKIMKEAAK